MRTVLGLLLAVLFAYLGSALFRLQRPPLFVRALLSSGLGFFAIGLVLGPQLVGLLDSQALAALDVLVQLGVGWVGLIFGLQFRLADLRRLPARTYLAALGESGSTFALLVLGLVPLVLAAGPPSTGASVALLVLALAAMASTTSPTALAEALFDLNPRGALTDAVRLIAAVDCLPAVLALGAMQCFAALRPAAYGFPLDGLFWSGVALVLGVVLGVLVHLFTLTRYDDKQMLVVMLGLVVFSGGAAHFLVLSPLLVNLVAGVVVANRSPQRMRILRLLLGVEKPLYLILLVLAGALWRSPSWWGWLLVAAFVALRLCGKLLGGRLATALAGLAPVGAFGLGPGLLAHGGMALMLALGFRQIAHGGVSDLALTAVVASIAVSSVLAPWGLRRLLVRSGEAA